MLNDLLMTYYNNRNKGAYSTKAKTANLQRYADAFRFLQEKQLFTTDDLDAALHSMQNSISAMKASARGKAIPHQGTGRAAAHGTVLCRWKTGCG